MESPYTEYSRDEPRDCSNCGQPLAGDNGTGICYSCRANAWLTITQVIPRLQSSRTTIARWCRDGLLAGAVKPGHDWLIPAEALDGFIPPTPGPKPVGSDQKRLMLRAKDVVRQLGVSTFDTDPGAFSLYADDLSHNTGVNCERARQALAKAIRLARKPKEKP